jgi:hypothetical protein
MTWARVSSFGIAIAVALIIIANAPAVLTDTLQTAIAQIRVNAATTQPLNVVVPPSETTGEAPTLVKKAK